jgi:hypothetical protein
MSGEELIDKIIEHTVTICELYSSCDFDEWEGDAKEIAFLEREVSRLRGELLSLIANKEV